MTLFQPPLHELVPTPEIIQSRTRKLHRKNALSCEIIDCGEIKATMLIVERIRNWMNRFGWVHVAMPTYLAHSQNAIMDSFQRCDCHRPREKK